jgi:hypothetical protein
VIGKQLPVPVDKQQLAAVQLPSEVAAEQLLVVNLHDE